MSQAIGGPAGEGGDEVSVARFIADQRTKYRVPHTITTCALLGVSVSWFYKRPARAADPGGLHTDVLRRSAQPLATRNKREHQWPPAAVFSEGNRPIALGCRRDRRRRDGSQQPTSQDTQLENTRRSLQQPSNIGSISRCCDDSLNQGNIRRCGSPSASSTRALRHPPGAWAIPSTTPSPRICGQPSRSSSSTGPQPLSRPEPTPRRRSSATSTDGTTRAASKPDSADSRPTSTKQPGKPGSITPGGYPPTRGRRSQDRKVLRESGGTQGHLFDDPLVFSDVEHVVRASVPVGQVGGDGIQPVESCCGGDGAPVVVPVDGRAVGHRLGGDVDQLGRGRCRGWW